MRSALYTGTLVHARRAPSENVFRYRSASTSSTSTSCRELDRRLAPLLATTGPTSSTLRDSDHLGDPGTLDQGERSRVPRRATGSTSRAGRDPAAHEPPRLRLRLQPGQLLLLLRGRTARSRAWSPRSRTRSVRCSRTCSTERRTVTGGRAGLHAREARCTSRRSSASIRTYRFFFSEPGERVYARVDVWRAESDGSARCSPASGSAAVERDRSRRPCSATR